jgi:orotidine-5'-phosphate decarboxylase
MDAIILEELIRKKNTFLCIGLDPDISRIPFARTTIGETIYEFNRRMIDATHDLCVAYKPNTAFYEVHGVEGWLALEKTLEYIRLVAPDVFIIIDAKRGDIGNTARRYAKTFFDTLSADAVTVAPYMGRDSVEPFLEYEGKMTALLALTSNPGAEDFELLDLSEGNKLYEQVLRTSQNWKHATRLMYVAGATRPEYLSKLRRIVPESFFLVPGVGAQGGDLNQVAKYGMNRHIGLLVNVSRGILYAGSGLDFEEKSQDKAMEMQRKMKKLISEYGR